MVSNSGRLLSPPSIPTEATSAAVNAWRRGLLMLNCKDAYLVTLLLSLCAGEAWSQTVAGVIRDSQGAALPSAVVTLTARDNTTQAPVPSDTSGHFRFERVSPGAYLIEASAEGLERSGARPLTVEKADVSLDLELRVAAVETKV